MPAIKNRLDLTNASMADLELLCEYGATDEEVDAADAELARRERTGDR